MQFIHGTVLPFNYYMVSLLGFVTMVKHSESLVFSIFNSIKGNINNAFILCKFT